MRIPKYLSPSSLKKWESNREEFYLTYLADHRPDRPGQTEPMSVGSAFDGFVKSHIYYQLFGNYGPDNEYERDTIFEAQVEPHVRDFAKKAGQHVFSRYVRCGALADMMFELNQAIGDPRFEFDIQGTVDAKVGQIPLLGKPDIFFINSQGARVIFDWKVNGYCGKSSTSPAKGYVRVRDTWGGDERKPSRNNGGAHKDCILTDHLGLKINGIMRLEEVNAGWADQLTVYGWLLGEEIGSEELIFGIDQIVSCGYGTNRDVEPFSRVANHRNKISSMYQFALLGRLNMVWSAIKTGHIFDNLSREQSDQKCQELDQMAEKLADPNDPMAKFVNEISRS